MGSIKKQTYYLSALPENAKLLEKGVVKWTDGGRQRRGILLPDGRVKTTTAVWFARYTDHRGLEVVRSTKQTDRMAALEVLRRYEKEARADPTEIRRLSFRTVLMVDHIAAYRKHMEASGVTSRYIKETIKRLEKFCALSGWKLLSDITPESFISWREVRLANAPRPTAKTLNEWHISLKTFINWAIKTDRLERDPLRSLSLLDKRGDVRRIRSCWTPQELGDLVAAAWTRPLLDKAMNRGGIADISEGTIKRAVALGYERAMLYLVAAYTGYRFGELSKLTVGNVRMENGITIITLPAAFEKARRGAALPVKSEVADLLWSWLKARRASPGERLFPSTHDKIIRVFDRDVEAAGLSKTTADGKRRDFHSLRTTLSGWLDAVPNITFPKHQAFMRHSAQDVTTRHYMNLGPSDLAPIAEALPPLTPRLTRKLTLEIVKMRLLESISDNDTEGKVDKHTHNCNRRKSVKNKGKIAKTLGIIEVVMSGRGGRIRTGDPLVPNQVR